MDLKRKVHKSQFVPKANWGHSLSPLTHVGFGSNGFDPDETTHSSYWLWNSDSVAAIKPRFSIGFPEEFAAFLQRPQAQEILGAVSLDLWVFRYLSISDLNELDRRLEDNPKWKVIFIRHQLNDHEEFFSSPTIQKALQNQQAYLSFLPPASTHDALLTPQQVIWNLESIEKEIPIMLLDVPTSQISFFNTLDQKILAKQIKLESSFSIGILKFLDRVGLGNLILFAEAFFGFLLSYKMQRVLSAFSYLFDLTPWREMTKRAYIFIWHKVTKPIVSRVYFKYVWPLANFILFKVIYDSLLFAWHKVVWPIVSLLKYNFGGAIKWLWGKLVVQAAVFVWYKIAVKSYHLFWNLLIKKYSLILWGSLRWGWGRLVLPPILFTYHKLLVSYPVVAWIFIRHKMVQPIYSFIRYNIAIKIWVLFRYKFVSFIYFFVYPFRKIYWILKHEYEKRIKYRGNYEQ